MTFINTNYLNKNTKICLTSLLGVFAAPDGYFYPCCVSSASENDRLLETKGGSVKEAFNSERIKSVRQQLANGEWASACQACRVSEERGRKSHRQIFNESYLAQDLDVINYVESDGEVDYPIKSLDIRWNNTCNFKCRMCEPTYSSAWEQDYQKLEWKYQETHDWSHILETDEFLSVLAEIRGINFAGGEPLITDAHYLVLEKLIELGIAKHISLTYTTNLSVLNYKQYDIVELWQNFEKVNLVFSLDGFGKAVEYSREGFKHQNFLKNFARIKNIEGIDIYSHCVSSIFSILSIPDYVRFCQTNNINFDITCINWPPYYSSRILSDELKQKIENHYQQKMSLTDFDYSFILDDMNSKATKALLFKKVFKNKTSNLDRIRNKKFTEYFPLFADWFESLI